MLFKGVLMKKVLFFNFLFLAIAFIILEIFSFLLFISVNFEEFKDSSALHFYKNWFNFENFRLVENNFKFRPIEYKNSEKRPIVLFGCSHTYGTNLGEKETFSYQLSNYTGRTVYNFAIPGAGTSSIYIFCKKMNLKKKFPMLSILFMFSLPTISEEIILALQTQFIMNFLRNILWTEKII